MIRSDIIDLRYITKVIFLCLVSINFGNTFDCLWLGIVFALYFLFIGCVNSSRRREFSKRPKYRKLPAYLAIVPLALYWFVTPGEEVGFNPTMVFLPGLYFLFLAALQERSRGNGGYEAFVNYNSMIALLCSTYHAPRPSYVIAVVGLFLLVFSGCRRGTSFYKYILFLVLIAILGFISYEGWQYWKYNRGGGRWSKGSALKQQMMGFDPVNTLGSFTSNFNSKYNRQVVLRIWDQDVPDYIVAARYSIYSGGSWKLQRNPAKVLLPAYYQVDYPVMEVADSLTRKGSERVWVQATLDNFGYLFAPADAVGFSAKDVDSLIYYPGGMVTGLDKNGSRSDWYYYPCTQKPCGIPSQFNEPDDTDLRVFPLYESLLDSVILTMNLRARNSLENEDSLGMENLQKIEAYFKDNFDYSLTVPQLDLQNFRGVKDDPLFAFWTNRMGYCEYYASLSVLTLRRLGYPARYVTGFARPERTPGSPYAIFRRKHAHSWVDVYIGGQWIVFDPTPVVISIHEEQPSWFENFWEGTKARFAKWMHSLKEGDWRTALDDWQVYLEKVADNPILYVVGGILLCGLVARRIYVFRRRKSRIISANSLLAKEWSRKLTQAEYQLSRYGFERESGETVGHFLQRIQDKPMEGKVAKARQILVDYEKTRWTL